MKTIGLIGGMSFESTIEYYRIINEEVRRQYGGLHSAKCILYSVDFEEIERCQSENRWHEAGEILSSAALSLEDAGADFIIICTNTMHKVSDDIQENIDIPILHIADTTAEVIKLDNIKSVGLLGTRYTMEQSFYKSKIEEQGIEINIPDAADRDIVNRIIFEELCLGEVKDSSRKQYQNIIQKLTEEGAEGIILGCTEIGLLLKPEDVPVPVYDTTEIHAVEAVNKAMIND